MKPETMTIFSCDRHWTHNTIQVSTADLNESALRIVIPGLFSLIPGLATSQSQDFRITKIIQNCTFCGVKWYKQFEPSDEENILYTLKSCFVLCTVICILTVTVTPYSSDIPSVEAYTTSYAW